MQRAQDVKTVFKHRFGHTPTHVLKAPGRLELLGTHAEHNRGLALSLAVDRYVSIAASPRNDGRIELVSGAFPDQPEKLWLSEFKPNPAAPWADPFKGVLNQMRQAGVMFRGFNAAFHSTIPAGGGLGEAGALTAATALMVRRLYPHRLTESGTARPPKWERRGELAALTSRERMRFAELCARAEVEFTGALEDLLGPVSSLFGKAFHAVQTDFLHHTVERLPLIGEVAVVLCDTGLKHPYAARFDRALRNTCDAAAKALGVRSLRSVEPAELSAGKPKLSAREYGCAYHIVGETQRVIFAERALREDDLVQFGQYLFQSHDSARECYRNTSAELDLLVELAREHPACLGARMSGTGFGGATVNVVAWAQADSFVKTIAEQYFQKTGQSLAPMRCKVVDGAEPLERRRASRE